MPRAVPLATSTIILRLLIGARLCQPSMRPFSPCFSEPLKNVNSLTAKFPKWYVKVLDPKVIDYSFKSKGESIHSQKSQRELVSHEPAQYMLGLAPFDFKDRHAFSADSVWEVTTLAFDARSKLEFNGCPLKSVVLLSKPTTTTTVLPTSSPALANPASSVHVALGIQGIVELLEGAVGSAPERKSFDFCGKFLGTPQRHSKDLDSGYWSEEQPRKVRRLASEPAA